MTSPTVSIIFSILVAFLFNTHIMLAGFCLAFIVIDCYDIYKNKEQRNGKKYVGLCIKILAMFFLIIQLWGCLDINASVDIINITPKIILLALIICSFIIFMLFKFKNSIYFITLLSFMFQFMSIIFVSHSSDYIINLILLNIIFLIHYINNKNLNTLFIISLSIGLIFSDFIIIYQDIKFKYSDAPKTTDFISKNINKNNKILCVPEHLCISLLANISNYNFFNMSGNKIKYMNYSNYHNDINIDINKYLNDYKYKYVIIGNNYKLINQDNYKLIYFTDDKFVIRDDENYCIYERIEY